MAPVLTKSLTRLRADFNTLAPARDRKSDGWIGDAAHQLNTSGHNPDDTPGSRAEYSDSDNIPEVRALDVDKDLRLAGVTMQRAINAILDTPADRERLRYIIFNRVIWRKMDAWRPRVYTGTTNPHIEHGHFSGDPAHDHDNAPFRSVLALAEGNTMGFLDEGNHGEALAYRVAALEDGSETVGGGPTKGQPMVIVQRVNRLGTAVATVDSKVQSLTGRVDAQAEMLQQVGTNVAELLTRPPVEIDYEALADAIFRRAVTGPPAPEGS